MNLIQSTMSCTLSIQSMSFPTEETVVIRDWSSLPADLVDLVGDHLLEDDDIDYYMDFRAVCKSWRKATKDPKEENCIDNGHFHPRKWILLDRRDDVLTFVNTETSRFIIKNMPLLHRYFFVGATSGGLIILDDQSTPPYHSHVLNPFTGLIAHFKACLPIGGVKDVVVTTSPMILFVSSRLGNNIMWADQNSEHFQELLIDYHNKPMSMAPFISNLYFNDQEGSILSYTKPDATIKEQNHRFVQTISIETTIPSHDESHPAWNYYLVESGGELLLVRKPWYDILGNPVVRRVDTKSKELEMVRSIGNRALFLSGVRCLSINANKFQTIEGGCIYFVDPILTVGNCQASLMTIFHIADQVQNVMLDLDTMAGCSRPFTLAQAFAEYCIIRPTD